MLSSSQYELNDVHTINNDVKTKHQKIDANNEYITLLAS